MFSTLPLDTLRPALAGRVILPGDADYDAARKVFNAMIDKHPAAIVQCRDVQDVAACVRFARTHRLPLAIRGGGHHGAGLGVCDDGLVIDLAPMKEIRVDPAASTVTVGAGCLLKEIDAVTAEYGLALPSGIVGTTGIGGLALGGGLGHLTRRYGLTIDNLLEAEVVLADGSLVRASAAEHADLFWALRGGGGNFGVVTQFRFRVHPVRTVLAGPMFWPLADAPRLLRWYLDFIQDAPEEVTGFFSFHCVPPVEPFPAELHGQKMCGIFWCGDVGDARMTDVLDAARAVQPPLIDAVMEMPFTAFQTLFDPLLPPGLQWYWKGDFFNQLPDEAIRLHCEQAEKMPVGPSIMHLYPVNGAAARVAWGDTAWNYRDATLAMVIAGIGEDAGSDGEDVGGGEGKDVGEGGGGGEDVGVGEGDDVGGGEGGGEGDDVRVGEGLIRWARDYWAALHPFACRDSYVNFLMDEGGDRVKTTYGLHYARLAEVKRRYDPTNLFHINHNIEPA